jgi:hypothetical protein
LEGVAAVYITVPVITETIVEGFGENAGMGLFEATHTSMAYGIVGSTALIPFYGFIKGTVDEAAALNAYTVAVGNCAGSVPNR